MRDFNFFISQNEISYKKQKNTKFFKFAFPILALLILTPLVFNLVKVELIQKDIQGLNTQINTSDNQRAIQVYDKNKSIIDVLNEYKIKTKGLQEFLQNKAIINSDLFNNILSKIPKGVTFTSIAVKNGMIEIQGTASNRVVVADFVYNLTLIKNVKEAQIATITGVTTLPEGNLNFTINIELKDVINYEN